MAWDKARDGPATREPKVGGRRSPHRWSGRPGPDEEAIMTKSTGTTRHWRRAAVAAAAVVTASVIVAVPLAGSSETSPSTEPGAGMQASGVYALSPEQLAYYAGFRAGQGHPLDIEAPYVLSDSELAFLSTPVVHQSVSQSADAAEHWLAGR
jgi:hypothetical protein